MDQSCTFRHATQQDVSAIVDFGNSIPELKVSAEADFMSREEVLAAVTNPRGVFLLGERGGSLVGFSYANAADMDRPAVISHACLVYIAVSSKFRKAGIGNDLYQRLMAELKSRGITYVYAWANPNSGVIEFMESKGWAKGHACVWMDTSL